MHRANLDGGNLGGAIIAHTVFVDVDLSTVKGLDTVHHYAPSSIGIDTIYRSKGKIPNSSCAVRASPPSRRYRTLNVDASLPARINTGVVVAGTPCVEGGDVVVLVSAKVAVPVAPAAVAVTL